MASFQINKILSYFDFKYALEEYTRINKLKFYGEIAVNLEIWNRHCSKNKGTKMFTSERRNQKKKKMPMKCYVEESINTFLVI